MGTRSGTHISRSHENRDDTRGLLYCLSSQCPAVVGLTLLMLTLLRGNGGVEGGHMFLSLGSECGRLYASSGTTDTFSAHVGTRRSAHDNCKIGQQALNSERSRKITTRALTTANNLRQFCGGNSQEVTGSSLGTRSSNV